MNLILAALLVFAPATLELPPEAAIDTPAIAALPAVRLTPPTTTAPPAGYSSDALNGRCIGAEDLLAYYSPGWSVERMSRIAWRESRCDPTVGNRAGATGVLQILASHCPWLAARLDTWCTRDRLRDPQFNIRAGAALWREQGYAAWSTS